MLSYNHFCSPKLVTYLKTRVYSGRNETVVCKQKLNLLAKLGKCAAATLDRQRSRNSPLPTKKELKKEARGGSDVIQDPKNGIAVTKWYDKKPVLMISN